MSSLHARCGCAVLGGPRPFTLAGTARVYERSRPFAIRHLALELELDVPGKSVNGVAVLDVERVDASATELVLDAVGFEIRAVELLGKKARHIYDGASIRIPVAASVRTAKVRIAYSAVPKRGLYFLAPDEHVKQRPRQVWSQCQDEDARHWFPCHDKPHLKMTFELSVTVPRGWFALSNGELVKRENKHGAKSSRYQWKMADPLPSYLVTLVAGEFSEIEAGKVGQRARHLLRAQGPRSRRSAQLQAYCRR